MGWLLDDDIPAQETIEQEAADPFEDEPSEEDLASGDADAPVDMGPTPGTARLQAVPAKLGAALQLAVTKTPDEAAKLRKLAADANTPYDYTARNPDLAERLAKQKQAIDPIALSKTSPETAAWLSEVENAAIARDDIGTLIGIEAAQRPGSGRHRSALSLDERQQRYEDRKSFGAWLADRIHGAALTAQNVWQTAHLQPSLDVAGYAAGALNNPDLDPRARAKLQSMAEKALRNIAVAAPELAARQQEAGRIERSPATAIVMDASRPLAERWQAFGEDPAGVLGGVAVESLPLVLPAIALTAATRNPWAAAAAMGGNSAAIEQGTGILDYLGTQGVDTRDATAITAALSDPETVKSALRHAATRAAIVGSLDAATMGAGSKMLAPLRMGATTLRPATREIINQFISQPLVGAVGGGTGEGLAQIATTGKLDPIGIALEAGAEMVTQPVEILPFTAQRIMEYRRGVADGKAEAATIDQIVQLSQTSELAKRDPEAFQRFMQRFEGTVYLPAEKVIRLLQSVPEDDNAAPETDSESLAALGLDADEIAMAEFLNGDLAVPLDVYVSKIAPNHHEALKADLRSSPTSITENELDKARRQVQRVAMDALAESLRDNRAGRDAVYQDVLGQLLAGGMRRSDAEANAGLYRAFTVLTERYNKDQPPERQITADQLYQKYALRIYREGVNRPQDRQQPTDIGLDPYLDAIRSGKLPTDREVYGLSLSQALKKAGGLLDSNGELANMDAGKAMPGLINNANGMSIDDAVNWAYEAGYIDTPPSSYQEQYDPDAPDANTLIDMLREDLGGNKRYSSRKLDMNRLEFVQRADELSRILRDAGIDLKAADNETARKAIREAFDRGDVPTGQGPYYQNDKAEGALNGPQNGPRGYLEFGASRQFSIHLLKKANLSTFLHETGHFFLEVLGDMAALENAPQDLIDDYAAILKYLDVAGRSEIGTEQHEKFARMFETYLGEGKAPTAELQPLFSRFYNWLLSVYRDLKKALGAELSDEVRGVFDRLLASEEELAAARGAQYADPLFSDQQAAGMSAAQWAAYSKLKDDAMQEARSELQARAYTEVKRETKEWWEARREAIAKTVAAELEALPVYRAWAALKEGPKLEKGPLLAAFGQEWLNLHLKNKRVYALEGGVPPALIAPQFGFSTTNEFVQALANAEPLDRAVKAEVDRRMKEEYGDMLTDGTLPDQALHAIHNNKQETLLHAELVALSRALGKPSPEMAVLRLAAGEQAGKLALHAMRPSLFLKAERTSARKALELAAAAEMTDAIRSQVLDLKIAQTMNAMLYRRALQVEEEIASLREYSKTLTNKTSRIRLAKAGKMRQVELILHHVTGRATESGRDWIEISRQVINAISSGQLLTSKVAAERLKNDPAKSRLSLTVDELFGLRDLLIQLERQAKDINAAIVNGERVELIERGEELVDSLLAHIKPEAPSHASESADDRLHHHWTNLRDAWLRTGAIARALDGEQQRGAWTRLIIEPIRQAVVMRLEPQLLQARKDIAELFAKHYTTKEMQAMTEPMVYAGLNGGAPMSRWDLIALGLNMGNAENRKAIHDSQYKNAFGETVWVYPENAVTAALATLNKNDWLFIQSAWNYIGSYWPEIKAANERRIGIAPKRVQARPFKVITEGGETLELDGGYFPLFYDLAFKNSAEEVEKEIQRILSNQPLGVMTTYSHNQEREGSGGAPVQLDINFIQLHVAKVIRDLTIVDEVRYVHKLLNSDLVKNALLNTRSRESLAALNLWIRDVAVGDLGARTFHEQIARTMQANFAKAKLLGNLKNALSQLTGIGHSTVVLGEGNNAKGAAWLALGMAQYMKHPLDSIAMVRSMSGFMKLRAEMMTYQKEIMDSELGRHALPTLKAAKTFKAKTAVLIDKLQLPPAVAHVLIMPIHYAQMQVDMVSWLGAYAKAKHSGAVDADAALYADGVVENAQTSGLFSDRAALERGTLGGNIQQSQWVRAFTTLMGYMIAKGNLLRSEYRRVGKSGPVGANLNSLGELVQFSSSIFLLLTWDALMVGMISGVFSGGDDDDEAAAPLSEDPRSAAVVGDWLAEQTAAQAIGTVPILREIPLLLHGRDVADVPFSSWVRDLSKAMNQSSQAEIDAALIKAWINTIGGLTGFPAVGTNRVIDAAMRDIGGEDVEAFDYILGRSRPLGGEQ